MERNESNPSVTVDLGTASVETRGMIGPIADYAFGQPETGLSDDWASRCAAQVPRTFVRTLWNNPRISDV